MALLLDDRDLAERACDSDEASDGEAEPGAVKPRPPRGWAFYP
jgi:hypothetical protein